MTEQNLGDAVVTSARKALALEALIVALVMDRFADLSLEDRGAKAADLIRYANDHIDTVDLAAGAQPQAKHDAAKIAAKEMVLEIISPIS